MRTQAAVSRNPTTTYQARIPSKNTRSMPSVRVPNIAIIRASVHRTSGIALDAILEGTFRSTAVEKACPTRPHGVLSQHGEQNAPAPHQLLNVTLEGSPNERLVAAVERRDPAVASFGRVLIAGIDQPVSRADMIAKVATLIRASPALQAREREVTARYTARLGPPIHR
jgi:hypothetical protein